MIESQPHISQKPIQFNENPLRNKKNPQKIAGQLLKLKLYMRYLLVTSCLRLKLFIVKILMLIKFK